MTLQKYKKIFNRCKIIRIIIFKIKKFTKRRKKTRKIRKLMVIGIRINLKTISKVFIIIKE
jgi:hypothetical protein